MMCVPGQEGRVPEQTLQEVNTAWKPGDVQGNGASVWVKCAFVGDRTES